MLKRHPKIIKALFLALALLLLWPLVMVAAPAEPIRPAANLLALPPAAAKDEPFYMYSSYEWTANGPARCPDPPAFKAGTRKVYSYIPGTLNQDTSVAVLWYEVDDNGEPVGDPVASAQAVLTADTIPMASLELGKGTKGIFGVYMFAENGEDWVLLGNGLFGIAYPGAKVPEPGACPLPEEDNSHTGQPDTDIGRPDTDTGDVGRSDNTADAPLNITWSKQMTYEGRQGESRWCQMSMTYQNQGSQSFNWPDFRPAFQIMNADGTEDGWYFANYYAKEDGWDNGITGTPPNIPAGGSADWTWYSATGGAGQYCSVVAVSYGDWVYVASYNAQGALEGAEVYPPEK